MTVSAKLSNGKRAGVVLTLTLAFAAPLAGGAAAEIQEYMIRRLLYLHTTCGVDHLEQVAAPSAATRRFKALCRNVSAYPDGVYVTCTDIRDDRSCKPETAPKAFDSLKLLRPDDGQQ